MSEPIRIIVTDRIYVRLRKDSVRLHSDLVKGFEHQNPGRYMKEKLGLPTYNEPRVIQTWEATDDADPSFEVVAFPRGGMNRIRAGLESNGCEYTIEDQREMGEDVPKLTHRRTLYAHQGEALDAILELENCILRSPTGSGKTTIIFGAIARTGCATLVVVPNSKLFEQWIERCEEELGLPQKNVGVVGGGKFRVAPVTIGIQKSVAIKSQDERFRNYFGMVVADEVDLFAAKTFFASIDPFPARYRFGVSADHRRKDRKHFLVHDLFGDVAKHIKHEDLVKSGHVLDVEVRVIPTDFRADWYGRNEENPEDTGNYDRFRLISSMMNDGERNRIVIRAARSILDSGDQLFVLAEYREHCTTLAQVISGMGIRSGFLIGGPDYKTEYRDTVKGLRDGSIRAGVGTYKAVGRGIDIPRVGAAVCVTPVAANEQLFKQVRGRVCRTSTGKSGARMIYIWDRHVFPDHLANLARWNANTLIADDTGQWIPAKLWINQNRAA